MIEGENLIGATAVVFNGVNARFTVVSATKIKTMVPAKARTGKISVKTNLGLALSATAFKVK